MTTTRLFVTLSFATVVIVTLARTGPGDVAATQESRAFQVTGIVTAPIVDGRVTVAHDEIPGYMPERWRQARPRSPTGSRRATWFRRSR